MRTLAVSTLIVALAIGPVFAADLASKKSGVSTDTTTTEKSTTETTEVDKGASHETKSPIELRVASKLEKQMNELQAQKDKLDAKITALQAKIDAEHGVNEDK